MKVLFLTSSLGSYTKEIVNGNVVKTAKKSDNSNHFIDRLKNYSTNISNLVFVASDPNCGAVTDEYAKVITDSLNLDGFEIKNVFIIDNRFNGDIEKTIAMADCVFLMGGNVPTQNAYFKEIDLKEKLKKFNGILIGQSAGSMNCASLVYTPPELDEEFEDKNFQRKITGLGLINFAIMPHMNEAEVVDEKNHPTLLEMCLEDSFEIPHFGICDFGFIEVQDESIISYGKTFLIKDGKCKELCKSSQPIDLSYAINGIV